MADKITEKFKAYKAHLDALVANGTITRAIADADLRQVRVMIRSGDRDAVLALEIPTAE